MKSVVTYLETHSVYPWYQWEGGLFRGYVYDNKDHFLIGYDAWDFVRQSIEQNASSVNGAFLFVQFGENECVILSDLSRSFTFLFHYFNQQWHIGDHGWKISSELPLLKDDDQAFHFEAFSFCPDHTTPWKGLSQIQSNEFVVLKDNGKISLRDFAHLPHTSLNFETANQQMMKRLLSQPINGNYVVPLSGGWDSRHLLANLKLLGIRNVLAYTYGNADSSEVKTAKEIAGKLEVEWHFVPYTSELLAQMFGGKGRDFLNYASQGICSPQEQEFFALLELTQKGVIKKGDVILPGYCGDLPAGSYVMTDVQPHRKVNKRVIKRWIKDRHLVYARGSGVEDKLLSLLYANLEPGNDLTYCEWNSLHETWFIKEKVSKYVMNGLRSYEYFGLEWRIPLWDTDWLSYSYGCHFEQRQNRVHFKHQANQFLFEPLGVAHPIYDNPVYWKTKWKGYVKDWIPTVWIQQWARLRFKNADLDNTNGRHLVSLLKQHTHVQADWAAESVNPYMAAYVWKLLG